jgi:Ca-activated chloride channel family protein
MLALATGLLGQFTSGVDLVEVYATVVDGSGRQVTDLERGEFRVFEDGREQEVTAWVAGEFPLAVALAVDRSFSMRGERLNVARAAGQVFLGLLRPADQAMVIAVGSEVEVVAPLGTDRAAEQRVIAALDPWGTTGLHDAIIAAIERIEPAPGRRALVLLSDGADRYSRATAAAALERARGSDVLIYPVAIGRDRPALFAELAVATGGRSFHLREPRTLTAALEAIATELRHQYLLGYTPSQPIGAGRPGWRSIEVRVSRPGVRVRARDGYMARPRRAPSG